MFYFSYQRADLVLAPIDVAKGEETEQTQEVNTVPQDDNTDSLTQRKRASMLPNGHDKKNRSEQSLKNSLQHKKGNASLESRILRKQSRKNSR